jgi:hypothetical protein
LELLKIKNLKQMTTQLKNSVSTNHHVSTEHVNMVIREYKQTRWVPNSERLGKPDSLSAWYSIEDFENFLTTAKSNGGDGLKIYFAAYPEDFTPKPEYAGLQTLVVVATKSKSVGMGSRANKDMYITKNGQSIVLGSIPINLCPPNCSPRTEGGMGDLGITIVDKGEKGMEIV